MPELHGDAQAEVGSAARWYEQRGGPGVSERLLTEVEEALDRIDAFPESGAPWPHPGLVREVRRIKLPSFRYGVFYVTAPRLIVMAFAHSARDPAYWVGRLDDAR